MPNFPAQTPSQCIPYIHCPNATSSAYTQLCPIFQLKLLLIEYLIYIVLMQLLALTLSYAQFSSSDSFSLNTFIHCPNATSSTYTQLCPIFQLKLFLIVYLIYTVLMQHLALKLSYTQFSSSTSFSLNSLNSFTISLNSLYGRQSFTKYCQLNR